MPASLPWLRLPTLTSAWFRPCDDAAAPRRESRPQPGNNGGVDSDPLIYRDRWRVRQYEIDAYGHVNNAVYLNWAEEMASRHAEASGFGAEWASQHGGGWVIRHHDVTYHAPARFGDELELMVQVELIRGSRGRRRTTVHRASDHRLLAEISTEWAWVRLSDGRPAPVPEELVKVAAPATAATLTRWADRRRGAPR